MQERGQGNLGQDISAKRHGRPGKCGRTRHFKARLQGRLLQGNAAGSQGKASGQFSARVGKSAGQRTARRTGKLPEKGRACRQGDSGQVGRTKQGKVPEHGAARHGMSSGISRQFDRTGRRRETRTHLQGNSAGQGWPRHVKASGLFLSMQVEAQGHCR
jgi:hypothetical protein